MNYRKLIASSIFSSYPIYMYSTSFEKDIFIRKKYNNNKRDIINIEENSFKRMNIEKSILWDVFSNKYDWDNLEFSTKYKVYGYGTRCSYLDTYPVLYKAVPFPVSKIISEKDFKLEDIEISKSIGKPI